MCHVCAAAVFTDLDGVGDEAWLYTSYNSGDSLAERASCALHWSLALLVLKLLQLECPITGKTAGDGVAAGRPAAGVQPMQNRSKQQAGQPVSDAGALPDQAVQNALRTHQELVRRSCEDVGEGCRSLTIVNTVWRVGMIRIASSICILPHNPCFSMPSLHGISCLAFSVHHLPSN